MQLRAEQLEGHLARTLAPAYLVHGDEPLLRLEAADQVRAAARARGFEERVVLEPARGFDWGEFRHAAASQSLFGEKKIIELRLATGKPAGPAAQSIAEYCANASPDQLLLVTMPRPEGGGWWKSEWYSAADRAGAIVEVQPVTRAQLPGWISRRLARQKQGAGPEVLEFIADRVEGNLLAAHQEVMKLGLLAPEGELSLETVEGAVASVARYDPATAVEALLAGQVERYVRILEGLKGEGESPTFVLFVLASALFVLRGARRGAPVEGLFTQYRLFNKPLQRAVQAAARRYPAGAVDAALSHAAVIDRVSKGIGRGNPWEEFIRLGLALRAAQGG